MKRRLLLAAIVAVLLFLFAVPLGFILYGAGSAIFGLSIIGCLIALQAPLFFICRRLGWIPIADPKFDRPPSRTPPFPNEVPRGL